MTNNLRELAVAATRGPYATMAGMPSNVLCDTGMRIARCDFDGAFPAQTAANGRYFAAASPDVVIEMIDTIERLRGLLLEAGKHIVPGYLNLREAIEKELK